MRFPLRSLKISQKLLLSILSFSVPILMLLYFTVSGISDNVNFARLEIFGNRLLEPLTHLLVLVPQHQRLEILARGEHSGLNDLETVINLIEKNFESLQEETKALEEPLKITPTALQLDGMEELLPDKIAAQWQALQSGQTNRQEQLQQYANLIQNISGLITRVDNTSNLILDPVLDSYYLVDVVLSALPLAQQQVGEVLLFSEDLTLKKQLTNEERVKLEVYATSLQQIGVERIEQGISTSLKENKIFLV